MTISENNSYERPEDDALKLSSGNVYQASLEGAIKGEYDFSIGAIIKASWKATKGFKLTAWGAYLPLILLAGISFAFEGDYEDDPVTYAVIFILFNFVIYPPLYAGIYMLGIHRAAKREVKAIDVFAYYKQIPKILGLTILASILVVVGLLLFILPGIYLLVAYWMAMPLMLEKKLGIWEALAASCKAITYKWFLFFGFYVVQFFIFLLALALLYFGWFLFFGAGLAPFLIVPLPLVLLGLGLIWVIPMLIVLIGILYQRVFGINPESSLR